MPKPLLQPSAPHVVAGREIDGDTPRERLKSAIDVRDELEKELDQLQEYLSSPNIPDKLVDEEVRFVMLFFRSVIRICFNLLFVDCP